MTKRTKSTMDCGGPITQKVVGAFIAHTEGLFAA